MDQGFVVKEKMPSKGLGRPRFAYFLPPRAKRQAHFTLLEPFTEIVSLTFRNLKHLCRFEIGGYCKKIRNRCEAQKRNKNHFTPILNQACALQAPE